MAEGAALMLATRKSLLASLQTQMTAKGVPDSLFDRATDLLTLVLLARLQHATYFLALVILNVFNLLGGHHLQLEMFRVIEFVARDYAAIFSTRTNLLNHCFASLAILVVTLLSALMSLTGKELLAYTILTNWNLVGAFSPFFTE